MKEYYVYKVDGGYLGIASTLYLESGQENLLTVYITPERALKFKTEVKHYFDSMSITPSNYIGNNDEWNEHNIDLVERAVKVKIKESYSFEEVEK